MFRFALTTFFIMGATFLTKGNALKCYQCHSSEKNGPICGEIVNNTTAKTVEGQLKEAKLVDSFKEMVQIMGGNATKVYLTLKSSAKIDFHAKEACFKITYKVNGRNYVYRTWGVHGGLFDTSKVSSTAGISFSNCEHCFQDLCLPENDNEPVLLSIISILFITLVFFILVSLLLFKARNIGNLSCVTINNMI